MYDVKNWRFSKLMGGCRQLSLAHEPNKINETKTILMSLKINKKDSKLICEINRKGIGSLRWEALWKGSNLE